MSRLPHGMSRLDLLHKCMLEEAPERAVPLPSVFGRLKKPANPVETKVLTHQDIIDVLTDIADHMGSNTIKNGPAAAGMTFLGQFVDHDVTLDATSALGTRIVPETITNVRTPALDLDCVYGSGPEASPHLYGTGDTAFFLLYGNKAAEFDVPRNDGGTAMIGDPRNDENAIISQIQANMIAIHNILMAKCLAEPDTRAMVSACAHMGMSPDDWRRNVPERHVVFEEVRRFLRMNYQYAVWHDLLPQFVDQSCLDESRNKDVFGPDAPIMPVEFSGAIYRFGHATAQPKYKLRNADDDATDMMDILGFAQRGKAIDMSLFFDIDAHDAPKARPIGTSLGKALTRLPFVMDRIELHDIDIKLTLEQSQNLPLRNMIRDRYTYLLHNGESFRDWMRQDLHLHAPDVEIHKKLKKKGITKTPLWLYALQEAEQHGDGKLTGVGGAIISSVFARLLRLDNTTYWHAHGFEPYAGFVNDGGLFAGMMKFAETHRADIPNRDELKNG